MTLIEFYELLLRYEGDVRKAPPEEIAAAGTGLTDKDKAEAIIKVYPLFSQNKKERFQIWQSQVTTAVLEQLKLLPTISSLAATLIVIATFNEKLLPITAGVKSLLTLLLGLIPISLLVFLRANIADQNVGLEKIDELNEGKTTEKIKQAKNTIPLELSWTLSISLSLIIITIMILIWIY